MTQQTRRPTPAGGSAGRRLLDPLLSFLHAEATSGILLAIAAAIALAWANSPAAGSYDAVWHTKLRIGVGPLAITEDLRHWVNDALMAVFFFVVGLEIKRELVTGELRQPKTAALPVLAACGGVVLPALIFLAATFGTPAAPGWGIPMATDIAFAVGVLALLGGRVPLGAKLFLLTIAIVDDLIAITVIAVAYSEGISPTWLAATVAGLLLVVGMREVGVTAIWPYAVVGTGVWLATFQSGVHATIAGVALGFLTPATPVAGRDVLGDLQRRLHPLSASVIVPLFALANAGVAVEPALFTDPEARQLIAGIAVALVAGKLFGIAGVTLLAVRLGIGTLPAGVTIRYVWGLAGLAGIGFTVSLFIADLAYRSAGLTDTAKVGILTGSAVAALLGIAILFPGRAR